MYVKWMAMTKTKCFITMSKYSKNEIFDKFEPLIEYGPHWINFIIFIFINEKKQIFKMFIYIIWNKIISFGIKKKEKFKTGHKENEEKVNLNP